MRPNVYATSMKMKIAVGIALVVFWVTIAGILIANRIDSNKSAQSSSTQTDTRLATFTIEEVARHNSRSDCWIIISGDVYDVTSFIGAHPGGPDILSAQCGKDATTAFETQGGEGAHSAAAHMQRDTLKIGQLASSASLSSTSQDQNQNSALPPAIVLSRYPGATIISSEQQDDEHRYTISVNGQCREIRIKDGAISRDRDC